MKFRKISLITVLIGLAVLVPATLSAATTSLTIGFDTAGNNEGFVGWNGSTANAITLTTSGGFLTGTAIGGDPRLIKTTATVSSTPIVSKLEGETWGTVVFRVRETDDVTSTYLSTFDAAGLVIVLNSTNATAGSTIISSTEFSAVASGDGFFTVTVNISAFLANDIRYFRFDPIAGTDAASNPFEIDYVQINAVPEPSATLLGAFGVLTLLRRRR